MNLDRHLFRTAYRKDGGTFSTRSGTIPARALVDWQIVAVDWDSEPEHVLVTFLVPGRGVQ